AIRRAMLEGSACALGAAALLAALAFPWSRGRWTAPALILFQALDLYGFKAERAEDQTLALTPRECALNTVRPAPYRPRRTPVDYGTHPRASLAPQLRVNRGWFYWSTDTYLGIDPPSNMGRTDHWLKPFDEYLRAMHGDSAAQASEKPTAYQAFLQMRFPEQ